MMEPIKKNTIKGNDGERLGKNEEAFP